MEIKILRAILNKTKKGRVRRTNIRLKLEVYEINNDIQKSMLRWFGYIMRLREERIPKKILHTKKEVR